MTETFSEPGLSEIKLKLSCAMKAKHLHGNRFFSEDIAGYVKVWVARQRVMTKMLDECTCSKIEHKNMRWQDKASE